MVDSITKYFYDLSIDKTYFLIMKISICTFDDFNEIDSFVAFNILSKVKKYDSSLNVDIVSNKNKITSMNGITIDINKDISCIKNDDIVIFGSGPSTELILCDDKLLTLLKKIIQPSNNKLVCSQCSGALFLEKLGLIEDKIATDSKTGIKLESQGYLISNKPLHINNNIVSAGGCLSSIYLAAFIINKYYGADILEKTLKTVSHENDLRFSLSQILKILPQS